MSNQDNNNEFLNQFFEKNNIFSESLSENATEKNQKQKTNIPQFPHQKSKQEKKDIPEFSQKDINLNPFFHKQKKSLIRPEPIQHRRGKEEEKSKDIEENIKKQDKDKGEALPTEEIKKEVFQRENQDKKEKNSFSNTLYIPSIAVIKIQSEFRSLYEDFLKILPIIEKTTRLEEIEDKSKRKSRGKIEFIPELWEKKDSLIYKREHDIEYSISPRFNEGEYAFLKQEEKRIQEDQIKLKTNRKETEEKNIIKHKAMTKTNKEKSQDMLRRNSPYLQSIQKRIAEMEKIPKDVFHSSEAKELSPSEKVLNTISKISKKKSIFEKKISSEKKKHIAKLRFLKRNRKKQEQKNESNILEGLKIMSSVLVLFIIGMAGLNYSSLLQVTEKYWNTEELNSKKASLTEFVQKDTTEIKKHFDIIPSLPLSGSKAEVKQKNEEFDKKMYLNVTPPDTRIIIPKLGKNIPIISVEDDSREEEDWKKLEKTIQKALQDGVVHYPGTANPGQAGNVFITGHSSYYPWDDGRYKDVFAALHDLEEGDEYYIYDKGKKYKYKIRTRKVVKPTDVSVLEQDTSKRISTLMTCTPIGTTARRLILQAEEVSVGY